MSAVARCPLVRTITGEAWGRAGEDWAYLFVYFVTFAKSTDFFPHNAEHVVQDVYYFLE
jgi:hypothetical protein